MILWAVALIDFLMPVGFGTRSPQAYQGPVLGGKRILTATEYAYSYVAWGVTYGLRRSLAKNVFGDEGSIQLHAKIYQFNSTRDISIRNVRHLLSPWLTNQQ